MRKDALAVGEVYHIYNKSIAKYRIFNNDPEYIRMMSVIRYYQGGKPAVKFSDFIRSAMVKKENYPNIKISVPEPKKIVEILAYCLMPTHLHLILKQLKEKGISVFMNHIQNSYTRYFNTKHRRRGPLWEYHFDNRLIRTDNDLLGMTRYLHLNPATARIVKKPKQWPWSSYKEYLRENGDNENICKFADIIDIKPNSYREFVEDRIAHQRELARLKDLLIDDELQPFPTGAVGNG